MGLYPCKNRASLKSFSGDDSDGGKMRNPAASAGALSYPLSRILDPWDLALNTG